MAAWAARHQTTKPSPYHVPEGSRAISLNQEAAYSAVIPCDEGIAAVMRGDTPGDRDSPSYRFQAALDRFWEDFYIAAEARAATVDEVPRARPTNAEYGRALYKALRSARYSPRDARTLAAAAREQRLAYGLADADPVPRIAGRDGLG